MSPVALDNNYKHGFPCTHHTVCVIRNTLHGCLYRGGTLSLPSRKMSLLIYTLYIHVLEFKYRTLQDCSLSNTMLLPCPRPLGCYGNLRALQVSLFRKKEFCMKPEEYCNLHRNSHVRCVHGKPCL